MSDARSRTLITAVDLIARLDANAPVVLLDVLDEQAAAPQERRFIPGAIPVHLDADFSGAPGPDHGKRPAPDIVDLQARARGWGVDQDSLVVVYDDNGGAQAARAWWTLRWAGFDNVRLLDGGLRAWIATGREAASEPLVPTRVGNVILRAGCMPTIDADQAALLAREAHLLDARGRAAYVGAPVEPGKPAAGHIPGARLAPSGEHVADGYFKPSDDIRARLEAIGVDTSRPIGVYCGSGNAGSHLLAAMHAAGLEGALYVGSWSHWSADPRRPVATGAEPG